MRNGKRGSWNLSFCSIFDIIFANRGLKRRVLDLCVNASITNLQSNHGGYASNSTTMVVMLSLPEASSDSLTIRSDGIMFCR